MEQTRTKVWKDVSYYSDGLKIAAHLYMPADWKPGDAPRPTILSLPGYTNMKDVYGMDVPRRLWEEGYFVLAIDNRGFGASEGTRGRQRPLEQAQDAFDALTFLETVDGVDPRRLGIYGTSFGGANAIWVTAFDKRVKAVVSSVMVSDGERWMRQMRRPSEFADFKAKVHEAAKARVKTGKESYMPLLDLMIPDPHTMSVVKNHHVKDERYVSEYDMGSAEACLRYKPEWVASRISPRPALIIYAENDELCPEEALHCYKALGEPKRLVILPEAQHYQSYYFVDPKMHEIGMKEAVAWFKQYL
jgi:dipeptidyl aminopeptidase/acylaminoacyl peptidase